jgi:hypothetical protein
MMPIKSDEQSFELEEDDRLNNEMSVRVTDDGFYFEISNPWAGDLGGPLGESGHIGLSKDEAAALAHWLAARLGLKVQ